MDDVEKVLAEIENDPEIMKVRFTGLTDETANVLEKHGFGVTKTFLLEKQTHRGLQSQARFLLRVLEKMERYPAVSTDRRTARLIVKVIDSLKFRKGRQR